jgi:hypothetical protein
VSAKKKLAALPLPPPLTAEREAELRAMKPIDRFSDAEHELKGCPGWYPTPHIRLQIAERVSGQCQSILLDEIMDVIFDKKGAKKEATIKFGALEKRYRYTRKGFELALKDAIERRLIRGYKPKTAAGVEARHWQCWVIPEDWASVKPYEVAQNPDRVPTARGKDGRYSLGAEPIPLVGELLKGVEDLAAVSVRSVAETSTPVVLTWERKGSVVSVVARDAAPAAPEIPAGSVLAPETPHSRAQYTNVRLSFAFREVLDPRYMQRFQKIPDDKMVAQIIDLMGGAPPEMLGVRLDQKIAAGKWDLSGLAFDLARDCAAVWKRQAADREAADAKAAGQRRTEEAAAARVEAYVAAERADTTPWGTIRRAIKAQIADDPYRNWFLPTRLLRIDGDALIVEVPDEGSRIYLADEYQSLADQMAAALNAGFARVVFVADPSSAT